MSGAQKIVVLGMMTKMPVPGVVWQTVHYLVGLERLGYEVYYVEAHARTPSMFMETEEDDGSGKAASFIDGVMRRFGFAGRWCYQALHEDGRCYGLSKTGLDELYRSAELLINLHGGTEPLPEHAATGRLVYVETDPVLAQTELHYGVQATIDFLEPHCAFFTFAENYGRPDCKLPVSDRFDFKPTRQPVVLDFWSPSRKARDRFSTISNWRQQWRELTLDGEVYSWSKDVEFRKFLDLPARTGQEFELALSGYDESDRQLLEEKGWRVRDALAECGDIDSYRKYIRRSRGEFTVAKDQNVRLRTGWFSDRSATYLASSKPVVMQDTGFSNILPTGDGLFAFATLEEAAEAIRQINSDYERTTAAAREIAREYFAAEIVLGDLLAEVGVASPARTLALRSELALTPRSRRPLVLADETAEAAAALAAREARPRASLVVVTYGDAVPTKLCLDSVVANTDGPTYELIVVDNGSDEDARSYLRALEQANPHVRAVFNQENVGFARALNQGVELARAELLVLMNNDVIVPPGWLARLAPHLEDPAVGLAGPVTNRSGNEAEVGAEYATYGEFLEAARARAEEHAGRATDIPTVTMFCLALRRDAYERLGPIDERFGIGLLEDDDYSRRARDAGYRLVCAEDVLVHHFGEASFGALVPTGEYNRLLDENKRRFEEKWGVPWEPYERRQDAGYEREKEGIRAVVQSVLPPGATVLIVSRGDQELLELGGPGARHFPQEDGGVYAGHHPADDAEAIAQLERLRGEGADFLVFPKSSLWWLEHYGGLQAHLDRRYGVVARDEACVVYELGGLVQQREPRECSIVIPVFGQAEITAQCLNALFARPPETDFEVIVVDDGSRDETPKTLARYGDRIRVVRHARNLGFATSCNDGAAAAAGRYLVFLNNDTIPQRGWLDALVRYAERHPRAAVVGSKLLFPDDTIQHAGVVVAEEKYMRHIYAGFPAEHPAVNKSRRFKIVTAACALFRREPFEQAGGFDPAFRNSHEDIDLCLRLGERGHEVHYCHESVLYHFESASAGRFEHIEDNEELYRKRWAERVQSDDLRYYLEDGLLKLSYSGVYPLRFRASPLLFSVLADERHQAELLLASRAHQSFEALQETVRLRARVEAAELRVNGGNGAAATPPEQPPRLLAEAELHWLEAEPGGPLVSVLLPLAGESARLGELLSSLLGQRGRACLELLALAAEAEADPERLALLRRFGVGLLAFELERFSLARARALAARRARGELVVLLGPGVLPADPHWLAALLAPLAREPQLAAVCSRLLPDPAADPLARRQLLAAPSAQAERERLRGSGTPPLPFQSASVALRADVLRRLPPPLDGGDPRWAEQLLAAGLELQHEPDSVALALGAEPRPGLLAGPDSAQLLENLREDWRYLERECELTAAELEEWRLRAALRRASEVLGPEELGGGAVVDASTRSEEVPKEW